MTRSSQGITKIAKNKHAKYKITTVKSQSIKSTNTGYETKYTYSRLISLVLATKKYSYSI